MKVRQLRHDFKYGANIFGLAETKNGAEHAAAYRERFAAAFNLATLPFLSQPLLIRRMPLPIVVAFSSVVDDRVKFGR